MSTENNLIELTKESGEILFVYSDKYNVYVIYKFNTGNRLFLVIADKRLYLERVEELETPESFSRRTGIRFFKPQNLDKGCVKFDGYTVIDGEGYHFTIDQGKVVLTKSEKSKKEILPVSYSILPVLSKFKIGHGIQKLGKFYFIGIDREDKDSEHPVYGVVDLASGKLETIYYLYSDLGEVVPACLSIDTHELTVYVSGKTVVYDDNNKVIDTIPYLEKFFYRG